MWRAPRAPIVFEGGPAVLACVRDITERKQAEERVAREGARTAALLRAASRLNAELEPQAVMQAVCEETRSALDAPAAAVALYNPDKARFSIVASSGLAPEYLSEHPGVSHEMYERHLVGDGMIALMDDVSREGGIRDVELFVRHGICTIINATLMREGELLGVLAVYSFNQPRKFTQNEMDLLQGLANEAALAISNARLYEEVNTRREELRLLSQRLVEVQEAERRYLARELHDEIGQLLTGLTLQLQMATRDPAAVNTASIEEAKTALGNLTNRVRELSLDLRPAVLDDLGLLPALEQYFRRYTARTGVRVAFEHTGLKGRFRPEVETAAYRLVQETLTNVARHAAAQEALVRVQSTGDLLRVQVSDGGRGFDPEAVRRGETTGLSGMRERALLLGGQFTVEARPGEGSRILAELPLNE